MSRHTYTCYFNRVWVKVDACNATTARHEARGLLNVPQGLGITVVLCKEPEGSAERKIRGGTL